ncbi:hypothetical protein PoB_006755200 [Plakobranchus ocellatus]|uniref:F-box domain-containing protein n=1 Tax=Plakobranchus ocellatus TaxID=259542 RepID=A0AAV4DAJ7_9GAST|nr:hypothetical protein PoB_006755200 [Plakobranchus ocellatus]
MDIRCFPIEILEKIFLHLDTQALAASALSDSYFADIIYSSHFLDEYCRTSLSCTWVTAADVCNACISVPYEFWFWVHTTIKTEDSRNSSVYFHNRYLTKIGTLKHMYIMWLTCGVRPSRMYSYSLIHELYSLPYTVDEVFGVSEQPSSAIKDCLVKIFLGLPEIMELTCGSLEMFTMQKGGTRSVQMDMVCNDGIKPKLPLEFVPLFSVEIILSALFGKNPSLLILIGKDVWILWLGYLSISFETNETFIIDNSFCRYFNTEEIASDIRYHAHHALLDMNGFVNSTRNGAACPFISGNHSDMATLTIELAQDHHRSLQQKFNMLLTEGCNRLMSNVINACKKKSIPRKEVILDFLKHRVCYSSQINEFVLNFLDTNLSKIKSSTSEQLNYLVYKCILERIACLFRNEIQFCSENRFCHSFLSGCVEFPVEWKGSNSHNVEQKIEKCIPEKAWDRLKCPRIWPLHVLSAACRAIPVLLEVLEADISFVTSHCTKYVVPRSVQAQVNEQLHDTGMCLTNRPPNKPRCPPLLTQIRLWSSDSPV